jgi:hypothetical protein
LYVLFIFAILFSPLQVLAESIEDAILAAQDPRRPPRELLAALVRAEVAALTENDCGRLAIPAMNVIVRNK